MKRILPIKFEGKFINNPHFWAIIVITLLLTQFLTAADYGLVAMMIVFLAVANSLMDSGFK